MPATPTTSLHWTEEVRTLKEYSQDPMATVLVVDDRHSEGEVLADILRSQGHAVVEAFNGEEALELARLGRPDLVITDILMPGMDGFELVKRLRHEPDLAHIPVVFCSAVYLEQEAMRLAQSVQVRHVLLKPCGFADVQAAVKTALATSGDQAGVPEIHRVGEEDVHRQLLNGKLIQKIAQLETANERLEREVVERERAELDLRQTTERLRELHHRLQSRLEEERLRMSREIHDDLGQRLTALRMGLAWLRMRVDDRSLQEKTDYLTGLVDAAVGAVQRLSAELRPQMLDDLGLIPALQWQLTEFQNRTGVLTSFHAEEPACDFSREQSVAVYRIVQEALTNVARHAQASEVEIRQHTAGGTWNLMIRDNGCGLSAGASVIRRSLGMLGMQERAQIMGGRIAIDGPPGMGTTVTVQVPLDTAGKPMGMAMTKGMEI